MLYFVFDTGVVYRRHRPAFAAHASDGKYAIKYVLAWPRAIMEAIVQP